MWKQCFNILNCNANLDLLGSVYLSLVDKACQHDFTRSQTSHFFLIFLQVISQFLQYLIIMNIFRNSEGKKAPFSFVVCSSFYSDIKIRLNCLWLLMHNWRNIFVFISLRCLYILFYKGLNTTSAYIIFPSTNVYHMALGRRSIIKTYIIRIHMENSFRT